MLTLRHVTLRYVTLREGGKRALGATSENRSKIGVFDVTGSVWPKFQIQKVFSHSSYQITR